MAFQHISINRLIFIVIIILLIAKFTKSNTKYNYLIPLHYDVKLKYDIYRNIFFGECNITIQIYREINIIATNIYINKISVIKIDVLDHNNEIISIKNFVLDVDKSSSSTKMYMHLAFNLLSGKFLSPGTYILKLIYLKSSGIQLDEKDFFYTNKEKDTISDDEDIKVINAGELFPYWESIFKTTFNISIMHHKNYKFLSSMPIRKQDENMNNTLWTHFDTSPLMYIKHLTIVITTFTNFYASIRNVKLWYRREMIDQLRLAENIVHKIIYYLTQKSTKNIVKLDYFVLKDFEHSNEKITGFILLREEDIIYNNTLHPIRKIEVANLIARETIFYWFDDVPLWSKEGFITFLAAYIVNQTYSHNTMDLFLVQTYQESLRLETLPTDSLPLYIANTVHSFRLSFYYIKSFVIWHMLYLILSDNVFWSSINAYTNIYIQKNTIYINNLPTTSFWNTVESALGITVQDKYDIRNFIIKDVVDNWSTKRHFPILYVTRDSTNTIIISYNNSESFIDLKEYEIYVVYTTKSFVNFNAYYFWLSTLKTNHYIMHNIDTNDWIVLNLQLAGYYRVNYDFDYWQKLAYCFYYENYTTIHALNRAQIIDDATYFLMQGQVNFSLFWNIISFLPKDTNFVVWYPMIKTVEYMTCVWPDQIIPSERWLIKEIFYKLLKNIGYDDKFDENDFTKCLREEAVKWLCVFGDANCTEAATVKLKENLKSSVQDKFFKWREWIYCKGLMTADVLTWNKVWDKWQKTLDNTFLEYLTCSTNHVIIQNYFELIITNKVLINATDNKKNANIYLLIVAKHVKNNIILEYLLSNLKSVEFSSKKQIDEIAILIVIITHQHNVEGFGKIYEFVINNLMYKNLVDVIKQKITKRKLEYERQVANYKRVSIIDSDK